MAEVFSECLCDVQDHAPDFIKSVDDLKAKGVSTVVCVSVNDPFVMGAWGRELGAGDKVCNLSLFLCPYWLHTDAVKGACSCVQLTEYLSYLSDFHVDLYIYFHTHTHTHTHIHTHTHTQRCSHVHV